MLNSIEVGGGGHGAPTKFLPCCVKTVCSRLMKLSTFGIIIQGIISNSVKLLITKGVVMAMLVLGCAWPKFQAL